MGVTVGAFTADRKLAPVGEFADCTVQVSPAFLRLTNSTVSCCAVQVPVWRIDGRPAVPVPGVSAAMSGRVGFRLKAHSARLFAPSFSLS